MKKIAVFSLLPLLMGCSHPAQVPISPALDVVSSRTAKIPGKWLLYVEAPGFDREIGEGQFACSAQRFPVAAAAAFKSSAAETVRSVLEDVHVVSAVPDVRQLAEQGARGSIVIRGKSLRPRLDAKQGTMMADLEGQAVIVAALTVESQQGRLLGQTVQGSGFATAEAGTACKGGSVALSGAVSEAISETMGRIAEALSNSDRLDAGS